MLNKNFYPTPPKVIKKMLQPFFENSKRRRRRHDDEEDYKSFSKYRILDPSAGSGSLIDWLGDNDFWGYWNNKENDKIHVIEIEPDLQKVLIQKPCTLVGSDFLDFETPYRYDLIFMNPPFDNGARHLLHAWNNVLINGDIVCLLNKETLENPYSKERQLLSEIIKDQVKMGNCTIEEYGQCFKNSERSTNVNVICVRLKKEVPNEFNFDYSDLDDENLDLPEDIQKNHLEVNDVLKNLEHRYNASIEAYKDMVRSIDKFRYYSKIFNSKTEDFQKMALNKDVNSMVRTLNRSGWELVLNKIEFKNLMTRKTKQDFLKKFETQKNFAYTKSNMTEMLKILILNEDKILLDCMVEVFDDLTKYHDDNRVYFEGWKTNDAYKINRKVIIPGGVGWDYGRWRIDYRYKDRLNDIDRALCHLWGVKIEKIKTIVDSLENHLDGKGWEHGALSDNLLSSTFFDLRYFKKGTLHLTFKMQFLYEDFNTIVCRHKGWLAPAKETEDKMV